MRCYIDSKVIPLHLCSQVTVSEAAVVAGAAIIANFFESYLGAVVQGRVSWLTNDLVNMIQISLAAALAIAGKQALLL